MALNDRKGGMVVRIRLSPKDCMAVVDIMEGMRMDPYAHSFSGCASLVFSSLIGVARRGGIIKAEEDGFQYLNRIGPFMGQPSTKVKRELTNAMYEGAVHGVSAPTPPAMAPLEQEIVEGEDRDKYMEEYEGLMTLMEGDPSQEVMDRFAFLQGKLF